MLVRPCFKDCSNRTGPTALGSLVDLLRRRSNAHRRAETVGDRRVFVVLAELALAPLTIF